MRVPGGSAAAAALALSLLAAPGAARADEPGLVAIGVGAYDVLHRNSESNTEAQFRLEYRFAQSFLWLIQPLVGAFSTTDHTFFGYAGIRIELPLGDHVVLMGDAAAGYWHHGRGLDLGNPLEFKSGVELAYRFADQSRLGVAFDHISNAGIAKLNPGVESLLLVYSHPIGGTR
ncbi:MAG TPA: acyloxyacyl hydrolase [Stellaceae bacterium]|nr:acyloxyacyl hydrolase [Stellaceae bacterium]